jgi:hypothetical protein
MARIEEIQARIAALQPPAPPRMERGADGRIPPSAWTPGVNATPALPALPGNVPGLPAVSGPPRPFDAMLAQATGRARLRPMAGPFKPEIEALITKYAAQNGLSLQLVRAVVQAESSGNPRCISSAGAKGLMQLMPEELRVYGVSDPFDPEQNIAAGTRHLATLMKSYNNNVPLALAAYNAGSGAVRKYGGVPPYAETQQYIRRITAMLEGEH